MLWYKAWRETRSRFLIGLALLGVLAAGTVFDYPAVAKLIPAGRAIAGDTIIGRAVQQAVELQRSYRGFVWFQWVRQNMAHTVMLFAILLGSGGLLSKGPAQFTLSLPVTRTRVLSSRAAIALAELLVLALVPSLVIPVLSPIIGEHYRIADAIVHGACAFVGASVFFSLAFLLSTAYADVWRPLLVACVVAVGVGIGSIFVPALSDYGAFGAMTAETYFRAGTIPWPALAVSAALTGVMFYGAQSNFARRDF